MVITRGKGAGWVLKSKGVKYMAMEDFSFGGGHTMQYTHDIPVIELYT